MHLIKPTDELRRQYEAGEIDREYYEAMRRTQVEPPEKVCEVCKRQPALVKERGKVVCAICALVARNRRRGW